jgi:hypothetical protein
MTERPPTPTDPAHSTATARRLWPAGMAVALGAVALAIALAWQLTPQLPSAAPLPVAQTLPAARSPPPAASHVARLAHVGHHKVSADARQLADWAAWTGDPGGRAFVIVDKKRARVHVFDPQARLLDTAPALLGSARGDHTVPGVGDKPISEVLPEEKTTPAGRFIARPGVNTNGEDIVWVDYEAAVSMHRVRPLVAAERRLQRLASATPGDNRISFGCINLPVAFYEQVLSPTVKSAGAVVYVLPETARAQDLFGSWDVRGARQLAQSSNRVSKPLTGSKRLLRYASRVGPGRARSRRGWRSSPG